MSHNESSERETRRDVYRTSADVQSGRYMRITHAIHRVGWSEGPCTYKQQLIEGLDLQGGQRAYTYGRMHAYIYRPSDNPIYRMPYAQSDLYELRIYELQLIYGMR